MFVLDFLRMLCFMWRTAIYLHKLINHLNYYFIIYKTIIQLLILSVGFRLFKNV